MCEQADEQTLFQLCLVSFGMLKFAGPILYRHIVVADLHQIQLLFFTVRFSTLPCANADSTLVRHILTDVASCSGRTTAVLPRTHLPTSAVPASLCRQISSHRLPKR